MRGLLVYTLLLVLPGSGNTVTRADTYGDRLGTVRISLSCNEEANRQVKRGLALLHHMTYEGARAAFTAASGMDSDCAMAYWGQAMSFIHPLWSDPPSEDDFKKGRALLKQARESTQHDEREHAYIEALEAYYERGWNRKETSNLNAFAQAWEEVYRRFPDDVEAASFYALAHMATADPSDKSFARQREAGAIAEKVLARVPDHAGAHHYIIHSYDYPPLAGKAVGVARSYGDIAPDIPHALHMPTHIFTRLGFWKESIAMNLRSADAALKHPAGDEISLHYLHAQDYVAYAYLQRAEDDEAKQVLKVLRGLQKPCQPHVASSYALAAVPARIALERHQWVDAARLQPRNPDNYPWERFPAMEAITHFARALGAARSGDTQTALQTLEKLIALREKAAETSAYWAKQIEIQRLSAKAWLTYEQGKQEEALDVMRSAAELEASTEKHPVTPGEVLPARELLADMLLEMGRYEEAHTEYEAALLRNPNRFNSLYGAGRAAELGGDKGKAALYYGKLIEMTANRGTERVKLQQAKKFLNGPQ